MLLFVVHRVLGGNPTNAAAVVLGGGTPSASSVAEFNAKLIPAGIDIGLGLPQATTHTYNLGLCDYMPAGGVLNDTLNALVYSYNSVSTSGDRRGMFGEYGMGPYDATSAAVMAAAGLNVDCRMPIARITDGTSNTIAMFEAGQANAWVNGKVRNPTARPPFRL